MKYAEEIFDRYRNVREDRQTEEQAEEDLRIRMFALDSAAKVTEGRGIDTKENVVTLAQRFERYLRTGE